MTFKQAVKEATLVLIKARGKSFKTTKSCIMKAVEEADWNEVLEEPTVEKRLKVYNHAFQTNGVHLSVYIWERETSLEVNLTPSYA